MVQRREPSSNGAEMTTSEVCRLGVNQPLGPTKPPIPGETGNKIGPGDGLEGGLTLHRVVCGLCVVM